MMSKYYSFEKLYSNCELSTGEFGCVGVHVALVKLIEESCIWSFTFPAIYWCNFLPWYGNTAGVHCTILCHNQYSREDDKLYCTLIVWALWIHATSRTETSTCISYVQRVSIYVLLSTGDTSTAACTKNGYKWDYIEGRQFVGLLFLNVRFVGVRLFFAKF